MRFGAVEMEPRKNPAVLDTGTWEPAGAWKSISALDESYFDSATQALRKGLSRLDDQRCRAYGGSVAESGGSLTFLAELADGQHVFIALGRGCVLPAGPIGKRFLENETTIAAYEANASTISHYVSKIRPDKGPVAMGATARLGIGSRMTTAAWPGVWQAMERGRFKANPIQNSVREVNLLEDVLAGRPPRLNYMANFGRVEEGHTGSTFEGLWVAGVLEALKTPSCPTFGADADHITIRRGDNGISRARHVIESLAHYTFFTLDVSDLLDYGAMSVDPGQRREIFAYHRGCRQSGSDVYESDEAALGRLVGKYWSALDAVEELAGHIRSVRAGLPFDLELSIDETPSGLDTFACLTTQAELLFLILECRRRGVPLTHVAPNLGVEKELDYRGPDGLTGLEQRIRGLHRIAGEHGVFLDCHSGDDLSAETRKAIGRGAAGHLHFKVSPALQAIFAKVLYDFDPGRFRFWWDDALDYARREAQAGSTFAADCLRRYEVSEDRTPSPRHAVFHYYNFATVGRRDENGQFIHRQKFYDLPGEFYRLYQDRVVDYLCEVANDVFDHNR